MALTEQDRLDIIDLINTQGHLVDAGDLERAGELCTPDVTHDLNDFGLGSFTGRAAVRDAALAMSHHPVGHHATNLVVTAIDDRSARVRSKAIAVWDDGTTSSGGYDDVAVRLPEGWRIRHRTVTARRVALDGRPTGAHEVLERYRRASIEQSVDVMRDLYAVDAVHEFPFAYPGVPARLEGRDRIVDWIATGWAAHGLRYERHRTVAVHDTSDSATIVVEQQVLGQGPAGAFALPQVMVLTTRAGQVVRLRDYVDVGAAAAVVEGRSEPGGRNDC